MTNPKVLYVLLATAGVSLVLVVHVLVVWWAIRWGIVIYHGSGTTHAAGEEDGHDAGLSAGELVRLPCHYFFKSAEGEEAGGDCAVCLEAFEGGDRCRQLPRCEHSFHAECVDSWLRKSNACPVCRAGVVDRRLRDGEAKAAASSGDVEMEERRRSSNVTLIGDRRH